MTRRPTKAASWHLAAVMFLAAMPLPVRAACDHPAGSFSAFVTPGGALPLPPLTEEADASAEPRRTKSEKSTPKRDPVPCVRCGHGTKGLPSGPSLRFERDQALDGEPPPIQATEPCVFLSSVSAPYSLELVRELERPPRAV